MESENSSNSLRAVSESSPESETRDGFSYWREQQRRMQEQVDLLAAQMAGNYYPRAAPPVYPEYSERSHDTRFPEEASLSPSNSVDSRRNPPRRMSGSRNSSSSGSCGSVYPRRAERRRPYYRRRPGERKNPPTQGSPQLDNRRGEPPLVVPPPFIDPLPPGPPPVMVPMAPVFVPMAPRTYPAGTSPFSEALEAAQVDLGVKITGIESFDGTADPNDHLNYYENLMICHRYNDITRCRLFVSTFKSYARTWFSNLSPRSIHSWEEFKALFLAKFRINIPQDVHTVSLENIKQEAGESLRNYIEKFKVAASKIRELRSSTAVDTFIRNMNYNECRECCKELCNKEPGDLFEAYGIASAYVATDERVRAYYPGSRAEGTSSTPVTMTVDGMNDFRGSGQRNFPRDNRAFPRNYKEESAFTPLLKAPATILEEIRRKDFFRPPQPMKSNPDKRDQSRYCRYHASVGHTTDQCLSLKYYLETLVKRDLLKEYVRPQGELAPPRPPLPAIGGPPRHVVDMIIGGEPPTYQPREVLKLGSSPETKAFRWTNVPISFGDEDYPDGNTCCSGPLTVQLDICDQDVKKVLVDNGSSVDIIFRHALRRMILGGQQEQSKAEDIRGPLYGFGNHAVPIEGTIDLPTTFGSYPLEVTAIVKYYIIDIASSYNVIIGRPTLFFLGAIISIPHMKVKFPTHKGPGELKSDYKASQFCYSTSISLAQTNPKKRKSPSNVREGFCPEAALNAGEPPSGQVHLIENLGGIPLDGEPSQRPKGLPRPLPGEPVESIPFHDGDPSKVTSIGSGLMSPLREQIIELLQGNVDVFALQPEDMPGIDENIAVHKLHLDSGRKPVKQKRRNFAPERQAAIEEEIGKLLKAKFIYEIQFPAWIANVVLVKKSNSKWRMCIDYTDYYPLPTIDQLVDATSGHMLFSFLDAFSGYNQIKLAEED